MTLELLSHPLSTFHQKAIVAFYELDVPVRIVTLDQADETLMQGFRAEAPMGKFPLLKDAGRGEIVAESSIIIEHLDQRYGGSGRLLPSDPAKALEARLQDRYFDHYVQTPMNKIVADRIRPPESRDPHGVAEARTLLAKAYDLLERQFAQGRTWAAGEDFTLADCGAGPALYYAGRVQPFADTHPALAAYYERLRARPSCARAYAESEPFLHLFPEG